MFILIKEVFPFMANCKNDYIYALYQDDILYTFIQSYKVQEVVTHEKNTEKDQCLVRGS
jgi:hypothetical protein